VGDERLVRRQVQLEVFTQELRQAGFDVLGCASRDWRLIV
jgi:hypothetical protein